MSRDDEIRYHIHVEPFVHMILDKLAEDAVSGVAPFNRDELVRAVWTWADDRIHEYDFTSLPDWFVNMVAEQQRRREEANIIEGETEGG